MLRLSREARDAHDANRTGGSHHVRCHAPFTSMYFDQFGNVLACCINTVHVLGSYPSQRVADIWSGPRVRELRAALADDDFSLGCHDCHSSISSGNFGAVNDLFDQVVADTPVEWRAEHPPLDDGRDRWPRMLEFALSTRCNLACTMCSGYFSSTIRKSEGLAPLPEIYGNDFIEEIRPFLEHVLEVKFYGGEPFLAPVNLSILAALHDVNPTCRVAITTNGTVWSDRIREILEPLEVSLAVSIDGFSTETFESIRKGASRSRVFEHLDRFADLPGVTVSLAICAMRQNWREIPDLVRFANERGMSLGFNVVRYPQDHSLSSADPTELASVVECWESFAEASDVDRASWPASENLGKFANILSEVRGWLAATEPATVGVELRTGSAAGAVVRRRDWLELLSSLVGRTWDPASVADESSFMAELDRLLVALDDVIAPGLQGGAVSRGLLSQVTDPPDAQAWYRFDCFAATLDAASVPERIRLMAGLPPALIAQGVLNEDPDVLATRFDSFFPPRPLSGDAEVSSTASESTG